MLKKDLVKKFLIVVIIFLVLLFSHRVYINYLKILPIRNYESIIKTNSFNFQLDSFGIYKNGTSTISATKMISKNKTLVFAADRVSASVKKYVYSQDSGQSNNLIFDSEIRLVSDNFELYIFDLLVDDNYLYVSSVKIPKSLNKCNVFQILKIPILDNAKSENVFWKSDSCIKTYPKNPGWHDFQGRLAAGEKHIYLTAGLMIYSNARIYPNPNVSNLGPNLDVEIEKNQLFGGVIKIEKKSGEGERVAKGFRGPSGIVVTKSNRGEKVFVVDHGPRGGDELNLLAAYKDFGWPRVSYGLPYNGFEQPENGLIKTQFGSHEGFEKPIYYWSPSIAPSQLTVLTENLDLLGSFARGDLILSSLKAHSIFRIKLNASSQVSSIEQVDIGTRIRDISVENKNIFLSTDDGRIIILQVDKSKIESGIFPSEENKEYFYQKIYFVRNLASFFDDGIYYIYSKVRSVGN